MKDEKNKAGLRLLDGPDADRWAVNCFLGGAMLYFVCALYSHTLLPQQNAFQASVQGLYLYAVVLLVGKILLLTRYTRPQLAAVVLIVGVWLGQPVGALCLREEPLAVCAAGGQGCPTAPGGAALSGHHRGRAGHYSGAGRGRGSADDHCRSGPGGCSAPGVRFLPPEHAGGHRAGAVCRLAAASV